LLLFFLFDGTFSSKSNTIQKFPSYEKTTMKIGECFDKGNKSFKNSSYEQARIELEKCLTINPNHYDSKHLLAQVFLIQNNWNSSLKLSDELIFSKGKLKDRSIRAKSYFELKEYDNAIADYNILIQLDYKNIDHLDNRGWAYYNTSNYISAKKDFTKMISLCDKKSDKQAYAFYMRGWCHAGNEDYDKAKSDYSNAILIKEDGEYYYARGLTYRKLENKKKSCRDFKSAISLGHSGAKDMYDNNCR